MPAAAGSEGKAIRRHGPHAAGNMINGVAAHPQVIHRFSPKLKRQFQDALLWNRVEHNLDRRRHAASAAYGATTPRRMAMRHGGGRGAEEKVRGAEPSGGFAARRRKRAGRGYMLPFARVEHGLPLRQRTLPPMPEQRNTSRTKPSTLYYNRAFQEVLLRIRGSKSGMPFPVFAKAAEYVYPVSRPPSPVNPAGG